MLFTDAKLAVQKSERELILQMFKMFFVLFNRLTKFCSIKDNVVCSSQDFDGAL